MASFRNPLGRWQRKITQLDQMMLWDCGPNAFAIIIGSAVGFFHVFWAVTGPECVDSAWDRAKAGAKPPPNTPGTGRPKHRRFNNRGHATGPAIGPAPGNWGPSIIPLGNLAQHIGYGLAIVDGFLNGVFYGASLARRYSGCATPFQPFAQLKIPGTVVALLPASTFILASWHVEADNIFIGDGGGVAIPSGFPGFLTVGCNLNQQRGVFPSLPDADFTWEIISLPSATPVRQNYGGLGHSASGNWFLMGKDIVPVLGDTYFAILVTKTEGVLYLTDSYFNVYGGAVDAGLDNFYCGKHPTPA